MAVTIFKRRPKLEAELSTTFGGMGKYRARFRGENLRRINEMVSRKHLNLVAILLLVLVQSVSMWCQSGSGRLQGTVHDQTGRVINGSTVVILDVKRGTETRLATNQDGLYVSPALPIGQYKVEVTAAGFAKWEGDLVLRVNQTAQVNPTLQVGSVNAQITVAADVTPLINDANQTLGSTLDQVRLRDLPQNGRSISNLVAITTPGLYGQKANGLNTAALEFVQDGAPLANEDAGGVSLKIVDSDAIGEVKVETSNSSAKFNRPASAIMTTKSGTNDFHGTAFETNRNNSFGIAKARQDTFTKAPKLIRNEFGASFGGPIILPWASKSGVHLYNGKDRSYFFFAFEGMELRNGATGLYSVPTEAMRTGDFSALTTSNGVTPIKIYDPATSDPITHARTQFPGNVIPSQRISPLAEYTYENLMPHATLPNVNPSVTANLAIATPNNDSERTVTVRIDQHLNDANNAYFRFTHGSMNPYKMGSGAYGPPPPNYVANVTFSPNYTDSGSLVWNHIFSPEFYVETVLTHSYENDNVQTGPNPNQDYASMLGLPNDGSSGFPTISGVGFVSTGFGQADNTRKNSQNVDVLDENFTKVHGNHVFQFGGRYRHERIWIFVDQNPTPSQVSFSSLGTGLLDPKTVAGGTYTAVGNTGHTNASFFLGDASSYTISKLPKWYHFRTQEIAGYFQDDWKITRKLTLNLGIRYEIHPSLHEANGLFGSYDFNTHSIVLGRSLDYLYSHNLTTRPIVNAFSSMGATFETPDQAGLPPSLVYGNYHDVAPRLGMAFSPFGDKMSLVVRGGYGLYVYAPPTRNFYADTRQNPPYQASFTTSYTSAASSPDGKPNYMLRYPQTVIAGQNSSEVVSLTSPNSITAGSFMVSALDKHYPSTFVHQWNLTVEKGLPFRSVVRISYVGNHGSNLEQYWHYNDSPSAYVCLATTGTALPTGTNSGVATRVYPNLPYGSIEFQRKKGYSNDNSLQLEVQRLHKNGWGFQAFYVLSNAFRLGGNGWRDSVFQSSNYYLPGLLPSDPDRANRAANYLRDLSIPQHNITWNAVVDIPVGRDRHYFTRMNRFADALVGGWEIVTNGRLNSQRFTPNTGYYEPTAAKIYKKSVLANDCRSGTCYKSYLWFNGYLPANQVNAATKGVAGIPTSYTPYNGPLIRTPADGGSTSDPNYPYYDTNSVLVTLANGSVVRTTYNPDLSPVRAVSFAGPYNWTEDASMFKSFALGNKLSLRVNADFFNVFNMQGLNNPNTSTGLVSLRSSYNTPRQFQLTARLSW